MNSIEKEKSTDTLGHVRENSNYERNIRYTIQITKGVLGIIGAWPVSNSSYAKRLFLKLQKLFCMSSLVFILIPGLLYTVLKERNSRRRMQKLGQLSGCAISIFKLRVLFCRREQIEECLNCLREDWRTVTSSKDRRIMMKNAKIGRGIAVLCVAFIYSSGLAFRVVAPLTRGTIVLPGNITIRPLAYSAYFVLFNVQKTPIYEVVFGLQFLAGIVQYAIISGIYCLTALFVLHGCGQLDILISRMKDITRDGNDKSETAERKVAEVVRQHVRVKSFLNQVEYIMQHVCLIEMLGTTSFLCLLAYFIIMDWQQSDAITILVYCALLLTFLFNILILCVIGELLMNQGTKVFIASCTLAWYRLPNKTARQLILVIATSSYPIKITAGKMFDLSFNSFLAVVKTSIAYLNLLRAIAS